MYKHLTHNIFLFILLKMFLRLGCIVFVRVIASIKIVLLPITVFHRSIFLFTVSVCSQFTFLSYSYFSISLSLIDRDMKSDKREKEVVEVMH